jgi:D-xylose 1-dehydrogenase (NADP+, D-xylono-1,5-lactone-forming)
VLGARSEDAPFRVVAVASRDAGRAEAYAAKHGIARAHGSYEALLTDVEVDAVYIALPNALHFEWTMRALAAGKHVLVEKPFTRKPEQVEQAWDEAERRGLVLLEGYMWRHSAQTKLLLSLVPALGELQAINSWFFDPVLREHDVRFVPELGGGALLDLGCYCVGALRLVAGREPDGFAGVARRGRGGVDERFAGTLQFGDLTATFTCAFHGKLNMLEVAGAEGVLRVPHAFSDPDGVVLVNGVEHRARGGDDYRNQLADFCAAIRGEHLPLISRADTLGQAKALDGLLRAAGPGAYPQAT